MGAAVPAPLEMYVCHIMSTSQEAAPPNSPETQLIASYTHSSPSLLNHQLLHARPHILINHHTSSISVLSPRSDRSASPHPVAWRRSCPFWPPQCILCKRPGERLLRTNLLAAHEGINCDCDGTVDVVVGAKVGQAHFCEGLGYAHYCFEVTDLGHVSWLVVEESGEGEGRLTVIGYAPVASDSRLISAKRRATLS